MIWSNQTEPVPWDATRPDAAWLDICCHWQRGCMCWCSYLREASWPVTLLEEWDHSAGSEHFAIFLCLKADFSALLQMGWWDYVFWHTCRVHCCHSWRNPHLRKCTYYICACIEKKYFLSVTLATLSLLALFVLRIGSTNSLGVKFSWLFNVSI